MENNVININIVKDINIIELGDATSLTLGNSHWMLESKYRWSPLPGDNIRR